MGAAPNFAFLHSVFPSAGPAKFHHTPSTIPPKPAFTVFVMLEGFAIPRRKEPRRPTTFLVRSLHAVALSLVMAWLAILALIAPDVSDQLP